MVNNKVYLSIGSNVGDSLETISHAVSTMMGWAEVSNFEQSNLYTTSPVSSLAQPDFLNLVVSFNTALAAHVLMERCWDLERRQGVKAPIKEGPRRLDIDLIFYGDQQISDQRLTVPHPRWKERLFVLVPLSDLTDHVALPNGDGRSERLSLQGLIADVKQRHPEQAIHPISMP